MSAVENTKRVFRVFWAWNDEKEERWLRDQAREGWHLKAVRAFSYEFERGAPADVAYRLDFQRRRRLNKAEYLGIFKDAGWEHVGTRRHWFYFRKAVEGGMTPEIFSDRASRIAKYRRVISILAVMLVIFTAVMVPLWRPAGEGPHSGLFWGVFSAATTLRLLAVLFILYALWRMVRVINRIKREQAAAR